MSLEASRQVRDPWMGRAVTALAFVLLAMALYFAWLLLTVPETSQTGATMTVAVIGLVGTVATGVVSLAGLLLKHTVDTHNLRLQEIAGQRAEREMEHDQRVADQAEKRLELERRHNEILEKQAEERLRLDTAVRAVELMSTPDGKSAPESQKAGALFALANLGQTDFALALLSIMWPAGQIESASAVWLIDRALRTPSPETQTEAAVILAENRDRLDFPVGKCYWPTSLSMSWNAELSYPAREHILSTLLRLLVATPRGVWPDHKANAATVHLYRCATHDRNPSLKKAAALAAEVLLSPDQMRNLFIVVDGTDFDPDQMLAEIRAILDIEPASPLNLHETLVEDLKKWVAEGAPPAAQPGQIQVPVIVSDSDAGLPH